MTAPARPRPRRHVQQHDLRQLQRRHPSGAATFSMDAHALAVSGTMRLLQRHLKHLLQGEVTADELAAIRSVVAAADAVRWRLDEGG